MTPQERHAARHILERSRRSYAAAPPFTDVPVDRETMLSLCDVVEDFLGRTDA
jgi:hypothetical protein